VGLNVSESNVLNKRLIDVVHIPGESAVFSRSREEIENNHKLCTLGFAIRQRG